MSDVRSITEAFHQRVEYVRRHLHVVCFLWELLGESANASQSSVPNRWCTYHIGEPKSWDRRGDDVKCLRILITSRRRRDRIAETVDHVGDADERLWPAVHEE